MNLSIAAIFSFIVSSEGLFAISGILLLVATIWVVFGPKEHLKPQLTAEESSFMSSQEQQKCSVDEVKNMKSLSASEVIQKDGVRTETVIVPTDFGKITVKIVGDRTSRARIVTYHDVFTNHQLCFNTLFQMGQDDEILKQFCIYHIDAPGHEVGSEVLHPKYKYPSMEELAEQVHVVINALEIGFFVGFGIGAGANVLMRYAEKHPKQVRGLILSGPKVRPTGYIDMMQSLGLKKSIDWYGYTESNTRSAAGSLYSARSFSIMPGLVRGYIEELKNIPSTNVSKYLGSYIFRSQISKQSVHKLANSSIGVLLIAGGSAAGIISFFGLDSDDEEVLELLNEFRKGNSLMNVSKVNFDKAGKLVTEEKPKELIFPITMFLESLGYFVRD